MVQWECHEKKKQKTNHESFNISNTSIANKTVIEIDSGDESDGLFALYAVKGNKEKDSSRWQGPMNGSIEHFHPPVPITKKDGSKHWLFNCKYCKA
jgi:hypothetical protein